MPKQRITKEMVVDAAFEIAKSSGMEQVLVKNIADRIGCSVQPIYSYCRNMDGLRRDVAARVRCFVREYVAERIDRDDLFRSTGRAYIPAGERTASFIQDIHPTSAGGDIVPGGPVPGGGRFRDSRIACG